MFFQWWDPSFELQVMRERTWPLQCLAWPVRRSRLFRDSNGRHQRHVSTAVLWVWNKMIIRLWILMCNVVFVLLFVHILTEPYQCLESVLQESTCFLFLFSTVSVNKTSSRYPAVATVQQAQIVYDSQCTVCQKAKVSDKCECLATVCLTELDWPKIQKGLPLPWTSTAAIKSTS